MQVLQYQMTLLKVTLGWLNNSFHKVSFKAVHSVQNFSDKSYVLFGHI